MDQNSNIDSLTIQIWLFQALNCAALVFGMIYKEQLMLIGCKKLKKFTLDLPVILQISTF